jgi:hypothetical protein
MPSATFSSLQKMQVCTKRNRGSSRSNHNRNEVFSAMPKKSLEDRRMNRFFAYVWQKNIQYDQLGDLAGISASRIARIASGRHQATDDEKRLLASSLDVEESVLFEPWSHLDQRGQSIGRVSAWLNSDEGCLFLRRLLEVAGTGC